MHMSCWHSASRRLLAVPSRPSGPCYRYKSSSHLHRVPNKPSLLAVYLPPLFHIPISPCITCSL
jgi:hypothetical protein